MKLAVLPIIASLAIPCCSRESERVPCVDRNGEPMGLHVPTYYDAQDRPHGDESTGSAQAF